MAELAVREMACELSLLSQPDGSASFSQGDTSVLSAVYGPGEVKPAKEILDQATVEVVFKPKTGLPVCADKNQERLLQSTCKAAIIGSLHPRSCINIILQELQNSGSFLACSVNAASLSLLDAAVPLQYMVAAVTCIMDEDQRLIVDPTRKQETAAHAHLTFAFESKDYNVVMTSSQGQFTAEQLHQALSACRGASLKVFNFFRETVSKKLKAS